MSFVIILVSCSDLTPQQRASGLYTTVPLTIYVGETEYRDDDTLDTELLADAMAMCGVHSLKEIDRSCVRVPTTW